MERICCFFDFCELESSSRSHRSFDVYVDNERHVHQFSPGQKYKKAQYDFLVTVTSGHRLKIAFERPNPMVSGIVIRYQSSSPELFIPQLLMTTVLLAGMKVNQVPHLYYRMVSTY